MNTPQQKMEGQFGAGRRRVWWERESGLLPPPEGLSGEGLDVGLAVLAGAGIMFVIFGGIIALSQKKW